MAVTLHRALYAYLSLYAPLRVLIAQRLYPSVAPQETTFPYVTIQRLGRINAYHMGGISDTEDTLVQVDCWALNSLDAQKVALIVKQGLEVFNEGDEQAMDDLIVDGLFVENELDDAERADDASERTFYRTVLTIAAWHVSELSSL